MFPSTHTQPSFSPHPNGVSPFLLISLYNRHPKKYKKVILAINYPFNNHIFFKVLTLFKIELTGNEAHTYTKASLSDA